MAHSRLTMAGLTVRCRRGSEMPRWGDKVHKQAVTSAMLEKDAVEKPARRRPAFKPKTMSDAGGPVRPAEVSPVGQRDDVLLSARVPEGFPADGEAVSLALAVMQHCGAESWAEVEVPGTLRLTSEQAGLLERHSGWLSYVACGGPSSGALLVTAAFCDRCGEGEMVAVGQQPRRKCALTWGCDGRPARVPPAELVPQQQAA